MSAPGHLAAIAAGLAGRAEELAALISSELGMPVKQAHQIQAGLPTMTFGSMPQLVEEVVWEEQFGNSLVVREPIGVSARSRPGTTRCTRSPRRSRRRWPRAAPSC